ncbi:MAG: hypothetical protein CV089_02290 [Nitrospira sp. WS110]|nr:hypothetical protein [Nitrospira sp. WS110]
MNRFLTLVTMGLALILSGCLMPVLIDNPPVTRDTIAGWHHDRVQVAPGQPIVGWYFYTMPPGQSEPEKHGPYYFQDQCIEEEDAVPSEQETTRCAMKCIEEGEAYDDIAFQNYLNRGGGAVGSGGLGWMRPRFDDLRTHG